MNNNQVSNLGDVLCGQDALPADEYVAHRRAITKSLVRLERRERFSRRFLLVTFIAVLLAMPAMLVLDRLPKPIREQWWCASLNVIVSLVCFSGAVAFPILLVSYLLRHLPNWWHASRAQQLLLLQQAIERQQQKPTPPTSCSSQSSPSTD